MVIHRPFIKLLQIYLKLDCLESICVISAPTVGKCGAVQLLLFCTQLCKTASFDAHNEANVKS